ncbi:MAG: Cation transport ATPase [Candidatus Methanohalarchaeum thermophilum]|uniref:Cation transport ATPase n=1 Tax=Methanohalarchaeum thermophilum TaxID=1903181 RepID=A0A1Q6DSH4_METT1|nr:MAG: Cation transport ATPase [Candidatus Methanohalarchaeum thermophilum]
MAELRVPIEDMSCSSCAATIKKNLKQLNGVTEANVNFATDEAKITYDKEKTDISQIYEKISDSGYTPIKKEAIIEIEDMSCSSCAKTIESKLKTKKGIIKANVNFASDQAIIEYDPLEIEEKQIYKAIKETGYKPVEKTREKNTKKDKTESIANKKLILTVFGAVLAAPLFIFLIEGIFYPGLFPDKYLGIEKPWIEFLLATPVQIILGYPFYINSYKSIVKNKTANMDVLIALGSLTAYVYSILVLGQLIEGGIYFDTAAMILVFITLGNYLEAKSKSRASQAIKKLLELEPDTATRIIDGEEKQVPVDDLEVGDKIKIRPGEKIPTDSVVLEGSSAVDESMITGESVPVEKTKEDQLIGGTINENGVLIARATEVGEKTALKKIVNLVKEAQSRQPKIQNVADKISSYFVPAVILNATIWGAVWLIYPETLAGFVNWLPLWELVAGGPEVAGGTVSVLEFSIIVFASAVIIACPCALGLATPAATMVGTSIGAENGILFKGGDVLERVKDIDAVVFDKTGTITEGKMTLQDVIAIKPNPQPKQKNNKTKTKTNPNERDVLRIAATAEKGSEHPLAKAIVKGAQQKNIELKEPSEFEDIPGHGIKAETNEGKVQIGNKKLMKRNENDIETSHIEDELKKLEKKGKTAMIVALNQQIIGIIATSDQIKPTSKEAIQKLKERNLETWMITGDNETTAKAVAEQVGIPKQYILSEVLPEDKTNKIQQLQEKGKNVMMVGDGVNDAPALATAYVGIAIGSGTDVAIEAGDVTLMRDDLLDVLKCIRVSEGTLSKIKQNLFWALFYNTAMIPLASLGLMRPELAAIAMSISSVSVLTNSIQFKNYKPDHDYKLLNIKK